MRVSNLCNLPIRRYSYWDWEPEREGMYYDGKDVRKQVKGDGYIYCI